MTEAGAHARLRAEWQGLTSALQGMHEVGSRFGEARVAQGVSLPVTILSGFLGAGKTTLLRRLLSRDHGLRLAVVVNDFGTLAFDAAQIRAVHGDVMELSNGCSCCAMGADFARTLDQIASRRPVPDAVVVEASGVADPTALGAAVTVCPATRLAGIVTVIDALAYGRLRADPAAGALLHRQLEAAHLVVLSRSDLVARESMESLRLALGSTFAGRRILAAPRGEIDPALVLNAGGQGARPAPTGRWHDAGPFRSVTLAVRRAVARDELEAFLAGTPRSVYRIKGRLPLVGEGDRSVQWAASGWADDEDVGQLSGQLTVIGSASEARAWMAWLRNESRRLGLGFPDDALQTVRKNAAAPGPGSRAGPKGSVFP